jgi:xylulokinase
MTCAAFTTSRALVADDFRGRCRGWRAVRDILAIAGERRRAARALVAAAVAARCPVPALADVAARFPSRRGAETGLIGCAIAAAFGLGRYPSLAAASDAMSPVERVFTPQRGLAAFYLARAESYRQARACALEMVA